MIKYIKGDITKPDLQEENNLILHICNDIGGWGAGVSGAISRKWPIAERLYREHFDTDPNFGLGSVICAKAQPNLVICNMIAQRGIKDKELDGERMPPIRYQHLTTCLNIINKTTVKSRIIFPLMGAGLSGGDWQTISYIVEGTLKEHELICYVHQKDVQFHYLLND